MKAHYPARVICLSAEAVETLYALGAADRIVGVTGFAVEPVAAREKPRVGGFSTVNFEKIDALKPDLVIAFSDVQADAASELIRRGHNVLATNQRSLSDVFEIMLLVGRILGLDKKGKDLVAEMRQEIFRRAPARSTLPKVYFEEWHDPLISGIRWVSDLIGAAGGEDIWPELRDCPRAMQRVVKGEEVIRRQPDIIIASWCGKRVDLRAISKRPGWSTVPAVQRAQLYEIPSSDILQPGPGLIRGFRRLREIIDVQPPATTSRHRSLV